MPVILATCKAEIRLAQGKMFERPHLNQQLGQVVLACHPKQEDEIWRISVLGQPGQKKVWETLQ
jgi:aspartate aminotransferase-like enzyme